MHTHMLFSRSYTLLCALETAHTAYTIYFALIHHSTAFHHCTFSFITAHFVHHCTLKQALTYMTKVLHWLPIASRIKFKVLVLVSNSRLSLAPSYLTDLLRKPMSSTSACPLRSAVIA